MNTIFGVPVLVAVVAAAPAGAAPQITEDVELSKPAIGLASGPDGQLWATQETKVLRIKSNAGGKPTEFALPKGRKAGQMAVGSDGALWFVAEPSYVGRITTGGVLSEFGPLEGKPTAIAAGPDGNIWVSETGADIAGDSQGALARVTPLGEISEFGLGDVDPARLAPGPDGALWFTDSDAVGRATTDGKQVQVFDTDLEPRGIAAGMGDGLWLATKQAVATVTTAGGITPGGSVEEPIAIALGPDGAMWFTAKDAIGRVTPDGTVTTYTAGLTQGNGGSSITAGPDGAMWFTHQEALVGRITVPPAVAGAAVGDVRSRLAKITATVRANALPAKATVVVRDPSGSVVAEKQTGVGPGTDGKSASFTITGLSPETSYTAAVSAESDAGPAIAPSTATFTTEAEPAPGSTEPRLDERMVLKPKRGKVRVRTKGTWTPLEELSSIPVGALVDTSRGAVRLETAMADGSTQTGVFRAGRFRVRQTATGMTRVVLAGRLSCRKSGLATASAAGKRRRKLWGSDSGGKFQTQGRESVATVRGTRWLTVDTCGGTLTRVTEGAVTVKPRDGGPAVLVEAGERHFVRHG